MRDVRRETADCVSVSFDVPANLRDLFRFRAGQNITLKTIVRGEELRRTYSICSSPLDHELRIAVKKIEAGRFSGHANHRLQAGDRLDVMPPSGSFGVHAGGASVRNFLAFAAGSGITPVISILKTVLASNSNTSATLVYGNRSREGIIFREQLDALKNRYPGRFVLHHLFSRQITDAPANQGRVEPATCERLMPWLFDLRSVDEIFICGPRAMIFGLRDWLHTAGFDNKRIHFELFNVPEAPAPVRPVSAADVQGSTSEVTVRLDGAAISFPLAYYGMSVLDAALKHGADLPFACKGGVCATCRARLVEGRVEMDHNYALEADELANGFILTCQSHPRSETIVVDFDRK